MLSFNSSKYILEELKPVFIFTGHDHFGCTYKHNEHTTEYTIRSMMGDFGGYTAVLDIFHTPQDSKPFKYRTYSTSFVIIYAITVVIILSIIWILLFFLFICVTIVHSYLNYRSNTQKKIT
jgi:hypothetical protein